MLVPIDTTPLKATFSPLDEATGVLIGSDIIFYFNKTIKRGTGNIVLKTSSGTVIASYDAATSTNLSISGSTLTINPTADLGYSTGYKVEFASGTIQDLAGNSYAGVSDYNFTTRSAPDAVPPTVTTFTPADEATAVSIDANIVVTFSDTVQRGTGNIVLKTTAGTVIATYDAASSTNLSISGSTLTINPTADLGYSTGYMVEFASGTIQDLDGNNCAGVSEYNFTTIPQYVIEGTKNSENIWVDNDTLVYGRAGDDRFLAARSYISGAVIYAGDGDDSLSPYNWANITMYGEGGSDTLAGGYLGGNLFGGDGNDIFNISMGRNFLDGGSGDDIFNIILPLTIPILDIPNWDNYLSSILKNTDITGGFGYDTLIITSDSNAKIISYKAGVKNILLLSYFDNIYVEISIFSIEKIVFNGKDVSDIFLKTINAAFSPADEAMAVSIDANIEVTFSEAVQRGTGNIVLKTSSGTVIATYDAASSTNLSISGSTLTINPTADLGYSTGYKVEFASGTIQDLAGNNYAGVSDYNFTTEIFDAAPTFANVPAAAVSHIAGLVFSLDDVTVADADSSNLSLTLNPSNGILLGLIDQDSTTAGTQISGTAAAINKALAGAMFVGTSAGAANIAMTLKDLANTSVATYPLTIVAPASSTDTDGDGVINSLEASDGNKDGIVDQYQANVASNATLTLVASSTQATPPVDATTTISNFSNVSALGALTPPAGMTEPGGVLSFNALVSAGKEEHFSILVAASLGVNGYWQQNSNGAWVNMASAINGGSVTQVGDQTRLDFVITDGGAFDGDHIANGIIQDIGLIGHLTPGLVGMPIVLPDDGFWF